MSFVKESATYFDISMEQADEIIGKYGIPITNDFVDGKITFGQCVSSFIGVDDLTINEKCFLTHICTYKLMNTINTIARRALLKQIFKDETTP